jgi:hypothetical protein
MQFAELLSAHTSLERRRAESERRWVAARALMERERSFVDPGLTVFVAGSMGRGEMGRRSDLDLFLLSIKRFDEAEQRRLIETLDQVNRALDYPAFSNRQYVKVYDLGDLLKHTGLPRDDEENCFTARMLLLLESRALVNDNTYQQVRDQVLAQYFRDERGKASYRPLFLLNDVLRYWRTLCLNYESLRHDPERPWWKKNINLKFSRMLTVFATVAALTVDDVPNKTAFLPVCDLSPLQRLAHSLDRLADPSLTERFRVFLDDYELFLTWKEQDNFDTLTKQDEFKASARLVSDRFSDFLFAVVTHEKIPLARRKYVVI